MTVCGYVCIACDSDQEASRGGVVTVVGPDNKKHRVSFKGGVEDGMEVRVVGKGMVKRIKGKKQRHHRSQERGDFVVVFRVGKDYRRRLKRLLHPSLWWPSTPITMRMQSWVEKGKGSTKWIKDMWGRVKTSTSSRKGRRRRPMWTMW